MRNGLLIDYEFCTGCQSCEVACQKEHGFEAGTWGIRVLDEGPWEVDEKTMNWNKIPTPTTLCDLCADRTAKGKLPTCVHHCLAAVMKYGPIDELVKEMDKKPNQVMFVPGPYICKCRFEGRVSYPALSVRPAAGHGPRPFVLRPSTKEGTWHLSMITGTSSRHLRWGVRS